MIKFPRLTRCLTAAAVSAFALSSLNAQYAEIGDAGASVGGAQRTGAVSGQALPSISGTILGATDGDFFYITISNPGMFSATTVGGSSLDTLLYLFTLSGSPVYINDDSSGFTLQSTLPAGSSFGPLAAGTYILGISLSGAEPMNAAGQFLFTDNVVTTDVRGPRSGANGPVTGVFNASFAESGAYTISLTGATTSAVPEPTSLALIVGAGLTGLVALRRRIHRS